MSQLRSRLRSGRGQLRICLFLFLVTAAACGWESNQFVGVPVSAAASMALAAKPTITAKAEAPFKTVDHPVTVRDVIHMTRIAGPKAIIHSGGGSTEKFASFSPDGKRFVFVTKKGNLERNTNDYFLLLYSVQGLFDHPHAKTLVAFRSSSNREAIRDLSWLEDSNTILFLGERPGETTQLYSVECNSGKVRRLTKHPTNLLEYSAAGGKRRIAYAAEVPVRHLIDKNVLRNGLHVSGEGLHELLAGHITTSLDSELFVLKDTEKPAKRIEIRNRFSTAPFFLSPDGRWLVVETNVTDLPAIWSEYRGDKGHLGRIFRLQIPAGAPTWVRRYELVDTETGDCRVLLNAPINHWAGSGVLWLPDSRSVVLTGVYLPLDVSEPAEREIRRRTSVVVEVKIPSLEIARITDRNLNALKWDKQAQTLRLESREQASIRVECYHKTGDGWALTEATTVCPSSRGPEILAEQNLNTPPRVIAKNPATGQKATLLDLNPQFKELAFGKVESIKWPAGGGREVQGGLYLPPDYVPGRKYPMVIQTHGFEPGEFWIDGPFSTANAAQPLAGRGIVVLQVPDEQDLAFSGTPEEAPRMMRIYEEAIDYLAGEGVIDLDHVGLVGFSHTCWLVKYALTHSKYHFAAAVVADGIDGGYFQYVAFSNQAEFTESYREKIIGAPPFGEGLSLWLTRSPGFLLDKVKTPIRIQAIGPYSLVEEWEWFAGLSRLKKPVDMVYIPDGLHILQKPWERMVSQQGDVDWFCFWLKDEEDSDLAKTDQYARWHRLRDLMHK